MISSLFTLEGLLRALKIMNQSKHKVKAAEVGRATAFAKMSSSQAVKQNWFMASA